MVMYLSCWREDVKKGRVNDHVLLVNESSSVKDPSRQINSTVDKREQEEHTSWIVQRPQEQTEWFVQGARTTVRAVVDNVEVGDLEESSSERADPEEERDHRESYRLPREMRLCDKLRTRVVSYVNDKVLEIPKTVLLSLSKLFRDDKGYSEKGEPIYTSNK